LNNCHASSSSLPYNLSPFDQVQTFILATKTSSFNLSINVKISFYSSCDLNLSNDLSLPHFHSHTCGLSWKREWSERKLLDSHLSFYMHEPGGHCNTRPLLIFSAIFTQTPDSNTIS
jgi:hypothetical protein